MTGAPSVAEPTNQLYSKIADKPYALVDLILELEGEPTPVLVALVARLSAANALRGLAPFVQAIIDRRLHDEQITSQTTLRETMENVSLTLLQVERNQKGLELANLKLARSANRLGWMQISVAVIFGIVGALQACGRL